MEFSRRNLDGCERQARTGQHEEALTDVSLMCCSPQCSAWIQAIIADVGRFVRADDSLHIYCSLAQTW